MLVRLIADTRCSHTTASGFFVAEDHCRTWLVDEFSETTELYTDAVAKAQSAPRIKR